MHLAHNPPPFFLAEQKDGLRSSKLTYLDRCGKGCGKPGETSRFKGD